MIAVILPVYNEGANVLREVEAIGQVLSGRQYTVIVVDDGSTDNGVAAVQNASEKKNVQIISHAKNSGLGEAIKSGLKKVETMEDVDIVVMKDADMTQDPAAIRDMLVAMQQSDSEIAIASRFVAGGAQHGVPFTRRLISVAGNRLFRLFVGHGITDYTTSYRAIRRSLLFTGGSHQVDRLITKKGFTCSIQLLLNVLSRDTKVVEVPLVLDYGKKIGASKMRVGRNVVESCLLLLRYIVRGKAGV